MAKYDKESHQDFAWKDFKQWQKIVAITEVLKQVTNVTTSLK